MIIDKLGEGHYTTRSGLLVGIDATNDGKDYPVKGYVIEKDGTKRYFSWTKEGIFHTGTDPHELDLITVAQPVAEPKQERPVSVGIPYTNEAERKAAIKQAESYGYKEWEINERYREETDNCIWLNDNRGGDWCDTKLQESDTTIPLDRSFMEEEPVVKKNFTTENYTFPASDYTKTENEDGTILLTPIDKDYQANYEKALNFLEGTPEVMWSREDLAKILVEFLNSVNHAD